MFSIYLFSSLFIFSFFLYAFFPLPYHHHFHLIFSLDIFFTLCVTLSSFFYVRFPLPCHRHSNLIFCPYFYSLIPVSRVSLRHSNLIVFSFPFSNISFLLIWHNISLTLFHFFLSNLPLSPSSFILLFFIPVSLSISISFLSTFFFLPSFVYHFLVSRLLFCLSFIFRPRSLFFRLASPSQSCGSSKTLPFNCHPSCSLQPPHAAQDFFSASLIGGLGCLLLFFFSVVGDSGVFIIWVFFSYPSF